MKYRLLPLPLLFISGLPTLAQQTPAPTQLTIYNGDFALARTTVPLDLHQGTTEALTTAVTSQLEPDSVVLRDPTGKRHFRVLEQNYDSGVVGQSALLQKYEGQMLEFQIYGPQVIETTTGEHKTLPGTTVKGLILRAGDNPLIEVDGHVQFQLPGMPLFPASADDLLLKPTLRWQIESETSAHVDAELDYITRGLRWEATYNLIVPELPELASSERATVVGWVTIENHSGTSFPQAALQLMAGDVAKLVRPVRISGGLMSQNQNVSVETGRAVTQKEFDDFHLYDLHRTVSLKDREIKQIQFLEVADVTVARSYELDGNEPLARPWSHANYEADQNFGLTSGDTLPVMIREEIKNSAVNHLGMPLPAGKLRLYRQETGGRMQFVGENQVNHTPVDQALTLTSGTAFDLTGKRSQTDFHVDNTAHTIDEAFEITLSNAKAQPVTIHAVEHLNRAENWEITRKSMAFVKRNSDTVDFAVLVPAQGEATLRYTVHYSW